MTTTLSQTRAAVGGIAQGCWQRWRVADGHDRAPTTGTDTTGAGTSRAGAAQS